MFRMHVNELRTSSFPYSYQTKIIKTNVDEPLNPALDVPGSWLYTPTCPPTPAAHPKALKTLNKLEKTGSERQEEAAFPLKQSEK